ncbi:uncharacterized protein LOC112691894 [Sipha flava]|uniref:Uncharacterized protein LOC112691894 n=2 Tax=Sipha flava TaxID=143950 RepID=A0A8B8GHP4_9HEMI|nr:uncharacterized protein LOC112691894 [Sipha flava]
MGCGHSDGGKSSEPRVDEASGTVTHRRDGIGGRTAEGRGDGDHADGAAAHYNNYGFAGFRTWTSVGFPVHRITRVMQVEQVDVCEEQNNKKFTNISNDDFNNSKGYPEVLTIHGSWIYGLNAGGSRNNLDMFETNPQYLLKFPTGNTS